MSSSSGNGSSSSSSNNSSNGKQRKGNGLKDTQKSFNEQTATINSNESRANCQKCIIGSNGIPSTSTALHSIGHLKQKLSRMNIKDVASSVGSALNITHVYPRYSRDRSKVYRQMQTRVYRPPRSQSSPSFNQMPSSSNTLNLLISESSTELRKYEEEDARQEFQRIAGFCNSCGIPFIDDSFPHSMRSLGNLSRNRGEGVPCEVNAKELIWLRPQEMNTKDGRLYHWTVFRDPKPTDIEQGALGNCWFLSALAVIAERPDILEEIVLTKVYNPVGVYQIRLCVDGKWQHVVLDDFFPCRKRHRSLAFAVGRRNQLWVPLIEKAFAKITGSYAKLLAGRVLEGLAVLTGSPCSQIDLEDAQTAETRNIVWAKLLSMREANFLMGCSCGAGKRQVNREAYLASGLQPRHAYSLLDVKEYRGCRLVRLRNPWGAFVWKGDWSDNWPGWNEQSRAVLLPNGIESGAFWMPYNQFLHYFDSVEVSRIRSFSGWKELRISCNINPGWGKSVITAFRIHVEESTEIAITFHQKGGREETDADLLVLVHEITASNCVGKLIVRSPRKMAAFVATDDFFLKGGKEYFLIPVSLSNVNGGKTLETVVVTHSAKPLLCEQIRLTSLAVTDSLIQLALKEGRERRSLVGVVSRMVTNDFDGHLLMYDNLQERSYLQVPIALLHTEIYIVTGSLLKIYNLSRKVLCDCSGSLNVISTRSTLRAIDSIPPFHRQIVMILSHLEATQGHSVHHDLTERLTTWKGLQDWASLSSVSGNAAPESEHIPLLGTNPADVLHGVRPT